MSERKLIIPTEIKLCATCSFWDGERKIDEDINVVIVAESCAGTCLCCDESKAALTDVRRIDGCIWENVDGVVAGDPAVGKT
jgi:hypothetical protein